MRLRAGLVLLALTAQSGAARADERITDFATSINVAASGTVTVTEAITVNTEGERIRHGLQRDIPTRYTTAGGLSMDVRLAVLGATLDGAPVPFTLQGVAYGERIRIGKADTLLSHGPHRFSLTYTAERELGFFPDADELYWNATGNFWRFPIDHASAVITFPPGAHIVKSAVYTGPAGDTGSDATIRQTAANVIRFEMTRPLAPDEGLTIAAAIAKGVVHEPTAAERRYNMLRDNAPSLLAAITLALLLIYLPVMRIAALLSIRRGPVIPMFSAPAGLSPAAIRYLYNKGYDRKAYSAAIVSMAVKRYLTIQKRDAFMLIRTTRGPAEAGLTPPELALSKVLFGGRDSILLSRQNQSVLAESVDALKKQLWTLNQQGYYRSLAPVCVPALLVIAAAATASWSLSHTGDPQLPTPIMLYLVAVFICLIFMLTAKQRTQLGQTTLEQIQGLRLFLNTAERDRLEKLNPPDITPEVFERFLPYAIALNCENRWSKKFAAAAAAAASGGAPMDYSDTFIWYDGGSFDITDFGQLGDGLGSSIGAAAAAEFAASSPGSDFGSGGGDSGGGGGGGGGGGW